MGYLITQILFCLLIAFILGLIIGWLLRRLFGGKESDSALIAEHENCKVRIKGLEDEKSGLNLRIAELTANVNQLKEKSYDLEASAASLGVGDEEGPKDYYDVEEIEGVGAGYGKRLRAIGIKTTSDLLNKGKSSAGRLEIAKTVNMEDFVVAKWVSMADLIRVPGIRGQFAELLEASEIISVQHLSRQNAEALTTKMVDVNARENRTRVNPTVEMVSEWIEQAKSLPEIISA